MVTTTSMPRKEVQAKGHCVSAAIMLSMGISWHDGDDKLPLIVGAHTHHASTHA